MSQLDLWGWIRGSFPRVSFSVWPPLLDGKAKEMVVAGSREEAVHWKLAIDKYIREKDYPLGALVAFSGEVKDDESGPQPFTERSGTPNPGLKGDIREAFKGDEFQILLVANKFQTGFDQSLHCRMYVDHRLFGIQAVQILSRLNRCHPGKATTYIVDFASAPPPTSWRRSRSTRRPLCWPRQQTRSSSST